MAKTKTKWRTKVKKVYSKSRGFGGGFKPEIDGLMAGAGGTVASRFLGDYGHPVAAVVIGHFRKNKVLRVEGARELGAMLAQSLPFIGGGSGGGGAY